MSCVARITLRTLHAKYFKCAALECLNSPIRTFVCHKPDTLTRISLASPSRTPVQSRHSSTSVGLPRETSHDDCDMNSITDDDPDLEKKLKVLFLEIEVARQEGKNVPSKVTTEQWKELVRMSTRTMRRKYMLFLFENEKKRENQQRKKEERKAKLEEYIESLSDEEDGVIQYRLNRNTMFLRLYDSTINNFHNNRLIQAIKFGQKIVLDCGYDPHMTSRESQNCSKQIMLMFAENRLHENPFDLYLCNAHRDSNTLRSLKRHIPTLYDDSFPINITEKSYLDVFPKQDLVYLTPHCREELTEYNHDTVYIIGALVDKVNQEPLSLAKAKKEGLKMAKFPLDRYLDWGSGGGKSLTLNQVVMILLDMKLTGDWHKALVHVPQRKLYHGEEKLSRGEERSGRMKGLFKYLQDDETRPRYQHNRDINHRMKQ
uniref:RNA (guanine-9-)-methyltransferase domain-containing protein 1 n=1 Tax=Timema bartmani TaxID=61472 RepID=A0A7R9F890_9NEOP|nr:unnamed protein product [Timema bartmani]